MIAVLSMKRMSLSMMKTILFLAVSAPVFAVSSWAADDKGTIGIRGIAIICVDASGTVLTVPRELKGKAREDAIAAFSKCAKWDIKRSTDSEIGTAMLEQESADGGVELSPATNSLIMKEYTIIRNAVDEVKTERRNEKAKTAPAGTGAKKSKTK